MCALKSHIKVTPLTELQWHEEMPHQEWAQLQTPPNTCKKMMTLEWPGNQEAQNTLAKKEKRKRQKNTIPVSIV